MHIILVKALSHTLTMNTYHLSSAFLTVLPFVEHNCYLGELKIIDLFIISILSKQMFLYRNNP